MDRGKVWQVELDLTNGHEQDAQRLVECAPAFVVNGVAARVTPLLE